MENKKNEATKKIRSIDDDKGIYCCGLTEDDMRAFAEHAKKRKNSLYKSK